jgi:fibronectin type 3 domain-containing protein
MTVIRPTAGQTLLWSDEFDGTNIDTSKWQIMDAADGSDSWFAPKNVSVSNGVLTIENHEEIYNGVHWTGGWVDGMYHPQYAYLEARMRIAPADCYVWATWWTIGWQNNASTWPPEFDICEFQGGPGKSPGQSYHWTSSNYDTQSTGADESQWHTYGVYWTATNAPQFYVDGVKSFTSGGDASVSAIAAKLKLTSSPNSQNRFSGCPLGVMQVDYVRIYDSPPPPPPPPPGLLSQGMPATASSVQSGNGIANGNDGSLSTRWTAATSSFPQWWRVDLGASFNLTNVTINWYNSGSRAYKYRIETSSDDSNYATAVDRTGNTTFGDTSDSLNATARYLRVTVTGCTASGAFASFYECKVYGNTGGSAPAAPTGLGATTASSSQINLSWNASSGATSYNVKRATVNGGPYSTIAPGVTGTGYNNTGLAPSTTYYYVVSALNANGESANSAQASATTLATQPVAPTSLSAVAQKTPGKIKLTWTQSSSGGITQNKVYRSTTGSGGPYSLRATLSATASYTDSGLTSGASYYYVVTAVNSGGESPYSNYSGATAK